MKLDTVIVSSNLNPLYMDFFPIVYKAWTELIGLKCILVLIADKIPNHLLKYKDNIILYNDTSISDIFQAQCIRLLIPGTLKSEGVLISDIDMIPISKDYFLKANNKEGFVIYRDVISEHSEYPMCYNAADSKVWGDIFCCHNMNEMNKMLKHWYTMSLNGKEYNKEIHWNCDQRILYDILSNKSKTILYTKEQDEKIFYRIDRGNITDIKDIEKINIRQYIDFHMLRSSNSKNKEINQCIYQLIFGSILNNNKLTNSLDSQLNIPLILSILNTSGSIVEIGITRYSLLIHSISNANKRMMYSSDNCKDTLINHSYMKSKYHKLYYTDKGCENQLYDIIKSDNKENIGVLFIDLFDNFLDKPIDKLFEKSIDKPFDNFLEKYNNTTDIIVLFNMSSKATKYKLNYKYIIEFNDYLLVSNFIDLSILFLNNL